MVPFPAMMLCPMESLEAALPYAEPEPSNTELQAALELVDLEAASTQDQEEDLHSRLPENLLQLDVTHCPTESVTVPIKAISVARYADPDSALCQAYRVLTRTSLEALDEKGQQHWQRFNDQLQALVEAAETALQQRRNGLISLNAQRAQNQNQANQSIQYMSARWHQSTRDLIDYHVS